MNISGLHINGFGVWSGLKLDEFGDGLTVIYGPNEAGKTTLLEFIRSVLYGYSPARRNYLPPVHGGDGGGWLDVEAGERLRIERRFRGDQQSDPDGQLLLRSPEGSRLPEHRLNDLLGDVDEAVYRNVFAVGLREIQELGTLGDTAAADLLYRLAAGMDRVSLVDVLRELGASRRRLLDPEQRSGQLVELRARWQQLRAELEERGRLTRRYARLLSERTQLDREVEGLEAENDDLERQARLVELAITLRDRWTRRAELDAQLDAVGLVGDLPDGAIERLDELGARLARHRERGQAVKVERERLRAEFSELKVGETMWRQAPRIEALREQQPWIEGLKRQVAEIETELGLLDQGLDARRERMGVAEACTPDELPVVSRRTLAALRPAARAVRQCRERVEQAKQEAAEAKETAESLGRQIDDALVDRGHTELSAALDKVGGRAAQLRQRRQLDEQLDEMAAYQEDLEAQSRRLADRQVLPLPILAGFGLLFALSVMLIVAGLVGVIDPSWVTGSMAWRMAMLGAVGVVGAAVGKVAVERTNQRRMESCRKQAQLLAAQIEQTQRQRETLDTALPTGGAALQNRLEAAERELAALEELVPLEGRRDTARQDAHAALGRVSLAEQELKAAARRWQEALRGVGLPSNLGPRQVKQLGSESDQVRHLSRRAESRREELASRRRELRTLEDRIRQLVRECSFAVTADDPMKQLDELAAAAAEQDARMTRRRQIRRRAKRLRRKLARHASAVRSLSRRRGALLRRVGAADEQQFRQRALEIARVEVLRRDRGAVNREIRAVLGDAFSEEDLARQFEQGGADTLETRRDQLLERLGAVETRCKERFEARGRLGEQLRALADDRETGYKRLELAAVEKRLEDAADRWRVLAVASQVLDSIRSDYERNRQPEALRQASAYLERFTEGRYRRVWTPLGEDVLRVEDAGKRSLPVEVLSRGTREQLFLSLRLALAGCYARRGASLPLVLDDVLVNFDVGRAKAAARVLRDFAAAGHQLLVFTCHQHIVKLFRPMKVPVSELPDHAGSSRAAVVVEKPAPRRKRSPSRPPAAKPEAEQPRPPAVTTAPEASPERGALSIEAVIAAPAPADPPFETEFAIAEPEAEEEFVEPVDEQYAVDKERAEPKGDDEEEWNEEEEPGEGDEEYIAEEQYVEEAEEEENDEPQDDAEEEFEDDEIDDKIDDEDDWEEVGDDVEEYEDEEDDGAAYAKDAGVFDADYFDSREPVGELDEQEWDDEDHDEEQEEYDEEVGEEDEDWHEDDGSDDDEVEGG